MVDEQLTIEDEWTDSAENEPQSEWYCDHPFRVSGEGCWNCGAPAEEVNSDLQRMR